MTITIHCPNCATKYKVRDDSVGANARCKKCGKTFTVAISLDETPSQPLRVADSSRAKAPSSKNGADSDPPTVAISQPVGNTTRRTIGKYLVQKKLGAGGMGEVWLGHDSDLQRDVAIKLLPAMTQDDESLKRFMREARLAAKLHHTNTVAVYEVGFDGKEVFIAMELVAGQSLDKLIEADGPLPWREATQAIRDAAAGLAAAHELGLIHRDIKPANLMRTNKGITKVVDFGLARAQAGESRLTQERMVLGTPAYMPPEQWMGEEVDARSDLYSLICTYYQLLTGHLPFDAPSFAALGYQHRHEPFPDPRKRKPDLPDAVCRILAYGSQKAPGDRFQTAVQLRASLDSLLATPDESLASGTPWTQLSQPATQALASQGDIWSSTVKTSGPLQHVRKHPIVASAAALLLVLFGIAGTLWLRSSPKSTPTNVAANPMPLVPNETAKLTPIDDRSALSPSPSASRLPAPVTEIPTTVEPPPQGEPLNDPSSQFIEEVEPQFVPVAATDSAQIEQSRAQTLQELRSSTFELNQVLTAMLQPSSSSGSMFPEPSFGRMNRGGPRRAAASSTALNLPQRFLLTGKLGGIRVQGRSTWVFLWVPNFGPDSLPGVLNGPPFPPVAGIEFLDVDLTQALADYRVGDEVCVVVKRSSSAADPPQMNSSPHMLSISGTPPQLMGYISEFRQFSDGAVYWTLEGGALEKPLRPETWIDGRLGRAVRVSNVNQLQRSPGQMMRNLSRYVGTKGVMAATFRSVTQSSDAGGVTVKLEIAGTCEGIVPVSAKMSGGVTARDFLGFDPGTPVLAEVRVKPPGSGGNGRTLSWSTQTLSGMIMSYNSRVSGRSFFSPGYPGSGFRGGPGDSMPTPSVGGTDPLTAWWEIAVDCMRLNKENDPSSLIAPGVERAAANLSNIVLTPTQAAANIDGTEGIDVTWTGKLREVRQLNDGTHFIIDGSDETPGNYEAFTREVDFIDQVADYVSSQESSDRADEVTVIGKLVAKKTAKERLHNSTDPLVLLTEIRRTNDSKSVARPDMPRDASSFDSRRKLSDLHALLRKPPEIGTEVKFRAYFQDFHHSSNSRYVRVSANGEGQDTVKVSFPAASKEALGEFISDEPVLVTAVVTKRDPKSRFSWLEFEGSHIAKAPKPM